MLSRPQTSFRFNRNKRSSTPMLCPALFQSLIPLPLTVPNGTLSLTPLANTRSSAKVSPQSDNYTTTSMKIIQRLKTLLDHDGSYVYRRWPMLIACVWLWAAALTDRYGHSGSGDILRQFRHEAIHPFLEWPIFMACVWLWAATLVGSRDWRVPLFT